MKTVVLISCTAVLSLTMCYGVDGKKSNQRSAQDYFVEANQLALENNAIADRCLSTLDQTKVIGDTTMHQLNNQRKKIEQMADDLVTVNENIEKSKRKLRSIESIWGTLANKLTPSWSKRPKRKEVHIEESRSTTSVKKEARRPQIDIDQILASGGRRSEGETELIRQTRILDAKLDRVDRQLDGLVEIAVTMGREISEQNQLLDGIHKDMNRTIPKITRAINHCGDIVR